MNKYFNILVYSIILIFTAFGCKRDNDADEITNNPHILIENLTVSLNDSSYVIATASIITDSTETLIEKGVCWSLKSNPTINNERSMHGTGIGLFTSKISGLKTNSTYYFRAYAVTNKGVFYGNEEIFLTDYYEYRGQVIDFISKQAVKDAKIYLGTVPFCEDYIRLWILPRFALTDAQGNFAYRIKKSAWPNDFKCTFIYAQTSSHVGSDVPNVPRGDSILNIPIQMYHPSTAKIRIVNDTISNDIDETEFALVYIEAPSMVRVYPGFIGHLGWFDRPLYKVKCEGRNYDTTLIINNLWGTVKYSIGCGDFSGPFPVYERMYFTAPSDSTVEYEISF